MTSDTDLLDVVGRTYDCALEPRTAPETLGSIGALIDAAQSVLIVRDPMKRECRLLTSWNVDPAMEADYMSTFVAIDPTLTIGWFREIDEPHSVVNELGEAEYTSSRLYKEWTRPNGFHDNMQIILAKSANRYSGLSFLRRFAYGVYSPRELAIVKALAPHLRRACQIGDLLDAHALKADMLSDTLDMLTVAIVLVDGESRIVHANRAALALLDQRAAIRRADDRLSASEPEVANELQAAIALAAHGSSTASPKPEVVIPMAKPGGQDLAAWVLPLDAGLRRGWATPFAARVAVFIREIGTASPFAGELFVKRYGITPAECRVLMMLTQGMTPQEAALALGISLATTKTHMARLFHKTETRGQPDLIRLAMSALAPAQQPKS